MLQLIKNFAKKGTPQEYLNIISRVSPEYLQNNDYQNSNIKKVGDPILKHICKINILAHGTGAENINFTILRSLLKFVLGHFPYNVCQKGKF